MTSDADIVQYIYRATVEQGRPPRSSDVAATLAMDSIEVAAAFRRIGSRRLLALAADSGEIVMAPPFSAVPTPFAVAVGGRSYFANCVWDSYGIAAALHADAVIDASCACCGDPIRLTVQNGSPLPERAVAHFAVPAAEWWNDIVYT
jgi:hypothetical protein